MCILLLLNRGNKLYILFLWWFLGSNQIIYELICIYICTKVVFQLSFPAERTNQIHIFVRYSHCLHADTMMTFSNISHKVLLAWTALTHTMMGYNNGSNKGSINSHISTFPYIIHKAVRTHNNSLKDKTCWTIWVQWAIYPFNSLIASPPVPLFSWFPSALLVLTSAQR